MHYNNKVVKNTAIGLQIVCNLFSNISKFIVESWGACLLDKIFVKLKNV